MSRINLSQAGDTIVEVMLAIAVVSAVLGGAFVSVNNSYIGTRQSQERSEAMKLLEAQLERLKEAARSTTANVYTGPNPFCVLTTGNPMTPLSVVPDSNASCRQGSNSQYALSVNRASDGSTFTARARWTESGGGGVQDEVILTYRVYNDED